VYKNLIPTSDTNPYRLWWGGGGDIIEVSEVVGEKKRGSPVISLTQSRKGVYQKKREGNAGMVRHIDIEINVQ